MQEIKLIAIDLDGTLLDTVPANAAAYRAALEEQGLRNAIIKAVDACVEKTNQL